MVIPLGPGVRWGALGVVAFAFTVPLTRLAVGAGLPPLFVGSGRAVVAAILAALALRWTRQRVPSRPQLARIAVVAAGVVVGFPLLTSFALRTVPASHGAVVIALLPAATAVAAVIRTGERPGRGFRLAAGAGAVCAVGFAVVSGDGAAGLAWPDLLLLAAVLACAIGYAEGGLVAREIGSWQTISWALVLSFPLMAVLTGLAIPPDGVAITPGGWVAFGYLGVVSMFLGFVAWYRGLGIGPMTTVSQVQLLQPVLTIAVAAVLLGERIGSATLLGAVAVVGCAALAVRSRAAGAPKPVRGPR